MRVHNRFMKLVSVFMDVEDPFNPLADDAARAVLDVFEGAGVRGSFCITGEKCRTLAARGRTDVIEGLRPHCLGLHTDTHSQHPTTMELLADVDYETGCRLALEAEAKGFASFNSLFERTPAFWGGAGNTWSCEIPFALRSLGIPAYSYALTAVGNDAVHRYDGVFALPQSLSVSEPEWAEDAKTASAAERVFTAIAKKSAPWLGVFVGHPTKLRHRDYWDTPYFGGRTPPEPEFVEPLPPETFERSLRNLGGFLTELKQRAEIVGVDELLERPWTLCAPTEGELSFFESQTAENIRGAARWPVHRPGLDPENMVAKALARKGTLEVAEPELPLP